MVRKPTESEEEYFARLEFEKRKKAEQEKQQRLVAEERKRLKDLHHMKCPKCGMELIEIDYKQIKIDKCSACDGIWLDAGELDAVQKIEKSLLGRIFGE
ncbi:MAG: zf-TFIIB domain-containing protein [Deltaproteobacteria bacterium]